jgi:hypothetical protein
MIYLASPYSHPDPDVMEGRFKCVCVLAADLMRRGERIFSPIAHTHPIAVAGELPRGWDFWRQYDEDMIRAADEVWVYTMDGWRESKGVQAEIEIAKAMGKPVRYVGDDGDDGDETK